MDKNQQPPVIQELGRLSLSIRDEGRKSESSELLRVGADESSASATFFFFSIIIWIHVLTNNIQANKNKQTKQILTYIKQRQYRYNTLTIWRAN